MAVSFGAERQAAFEHAKTKTTISMWQPNGTIYTFGRDVNVMWRHGIPGMVFQIRAHVRVHQGHVTHARPDILSVIENPIQLFIRTSTPTKAESRLLLGD